MRRTFARFRPILQEREVMGMLRLLDLLPIRPEDLARYKLHLATGIKDNREPLYELAKSSFQDWQEWQSKKNFERDYILTLIYYNRNHEWVFGGIYGRIGVKRVKGRPGYPYKYDTDLLDTGKELIGRLVVSFRRPGRQSYLYLEKWADQIEVVELSRTPLTIAFPG
jgi:hypothetical protein